MKTVAIICLILGGLSLIGAAYKGDSVFGPLFFIALGAFFAHRHANRKDSQNNKYTNPSFSDNIKSIEESVSQPIQITKAKSVSDYHPDTTENLQSKLTTQQKEASLCLLSFFGGFNNNLEDEVPMIVFRQASSFFGIPYSATAISQMMAKFSDSDLLIDTVLTIQSPKVKEYLLLCCYDLIKSVNNPDAHEILYNIANDMGYNKFKMRQLITKYS